MLSRPFTLIWEPRCVTTWLALDSSIAEMRSLREHNFASYLAHMIFSDKN